MSNSPSPTLLVRNQFVLEIETQFTHFGNQVEMSTSYSGDMYPYEWVVHRFRKILEQDAGEAREYALSAVKLLGTSESATVRDNCIAFLQDASQVDFIEELLAVMAARSAELRSSTISLQGTLGPTQLAGCYAALFRNQACPSKNATLNVEELRELVFYGDSAELVYWLAPVDRDWVAAHLEEYCKRYATRLSGPEMFRMMYVVLEMDPFESAQTLIALFGNDGWRLKDLWSCLEVFAAIAERKGTHPTFVDFVKDVGARARQEVS